MRIPAKKVVCSWCGAGDEAGTVVHYLRGRHHAPCLLARLSAEEKTGKRTKGLCK